jgi:hypothetical protein
MHSLHRVLDAEVGRILFGRLRRARAGGAADRPLRRAPAPSAHAGCLDFLCSSACASEPPRRDGLASPPLDRVCASPQRGGPLCARGHSTPRGPGRAQQDGMDSVVPGSRRASKVRVIHSRPPFLTVPTPTYLKLEFRMFARWPALLMKLRYSERTPRGVRPTFSPRVIHLVTRRAKVPAGV